MRHLLLLALAATVATATIVPSYESVRESIFRPGVEYIYRYESEALTGIRTVSDQLTGVKVRAIVKVQIHRDGSTVLKMENVQVYKIMEGVRRESRFEMIPEHLLTKLTGEQEQLMIEQLMKPIKFRMTEGEVRDVKTEETDEFWSINIKKGLVSLFQLKINGRSSITDTESYLAESSSRPMNRFYSLVNPLSRRSRSLAVDNILKVVELDVNGECETKYVVNSQRAVDYSTVSNMVVTKVKNLDKCVTRNSFEEGLFAGLPHYETEKKLIQPSLEAEYIVSGDRHHFLIRKAQLQAKYIFTPYGQEGGQISSHIVQQLQLVRTTEIQTPISLGSFVTEKFGLKMEIPRVEWSEESSMRSREQLANEWEYKQLIERKLVQLLGSIYPTMQESSAILLMQLNLIVRDVPRQHLLSIVKSYLRNADELSQKKSEILLDILPTIQTPEVAEVLVELIRDESIRGIRSRLSIAAMSLTVKPTPIVVHKLLSLFKESSSLERHTPMLRQTVLLSVGTICNKMINTMRRQNKPIPQLMTAVEEASAELMSMLEQAQTEKEKILVLKSMGNFGSKELALPIKNVLEDKSKPLIVRTQAIFALRKISKAFKQLVHPLLIKVVMDKQEPEKLRASAFMVLKKSHPSFITLQVIAHSLRTEPSKQIKTLVYTSLINMATFKSHIPEIRITSRDARKVLKLMRPIQVGILDSKECGGDWYTETLKLGGKFNVWSLKSPLGLPKNLVAALRATVFGNHVPLLSGGIEGRGIETILRRLVGPYGLLRDIVQNRATLYELLRPLTGPHFTHMAEKLQQFIGRRAFEPRTEEIKGIMYGEILGQEMIYNEFDSELIERLMQLAVRTGPELINKLKEGINVDALKTLTVSQNSLLLRTPMGVPLSLNVSAAAVVKLQGFVKANSLPELSDFLLNRPFMSKKIEIISDIKPSVNMHVHGYMGVDMRWIRSATQIAAKIKGTVPIKGELIVDPVDGKVAIKYDQPTQTVHLITAKLEPLNFVLFVPRSLQQLPFSYELKPIHPRENVQSMVWQKNVRSEMISSAFDVKLEWTKCMTSWCAYYPLNGKQEFTVIYSPLQTSSSIKEIVLKVKKLSQNIYEEEGVENVFLPTSRSSRNYRLESRELMNVEEFVPMELEQIISTPRKLELLMEMEARGFRSDKRVKAKVTWVAEDNYLEHQLNVQVVGIDNDDIAKFKLMLNGLLRCPVTIESLSHYVRSGEVVGKLDVFWGSDSFRENVVKSKVWKMSKSSWSSELQQQGVEHYWSNDYLQAVMPSIFSYGLEVELPRINNVGLKYLTYALDIIKMTLYKHVQIGIPEDISHNKIIVLAQYATKLDKLSVIIKTARETDFLLDIPVTSMWTWSSSLASLHDISPLKLYRNFTFLDMKQFQLANFDSYKTFDTKFTPSFTGECKVHGDKMLTFDGSPLILPIYSTETPSSRCRVLLAHDCSERGLFSVSGSFKHGRWIIKMVVPSYELELAPESSLGDNVLLVVNGRQMRLTSSSPVQLPSLISPSQKPVVVVEKTLDEIVKIKDIELGLTIVLSKQNKIWIKMSPLSMLHGKLCGLCGNNNYDTSDDMTTLDKQLVSSSQLFVMDNLLPSSDCDVTDYQTQLGLRHQEFCKKEKTLKLERSSELEDEICFSRSPITVCRSHCIPETTVRRTVSLVCLPRRDSLARQLLAKYHAGQTLLTDQLLSLTTTPRLVTKEIEVAEKCVSEL